MRKYLSLLVTLLAVGCVDKSIDILEVGGNVGIGADNLAIPLGYLPEKSLGELIGNEVDNLVVDPVRVTTRLSIPLSSRLLQSMARVIVLHSLLQLLTLRWTIRRLNFLRLSLL